MPGLASRPARYLKSKPLIIKKLLAFVLQDSASRKANQRVNISGRYLYRPMDISHCYSKETQEGAQVSPGQMYENGEFVSQSYVLAAKWYRKAAEHVWNGGGAGQGRNNLGLFYPSGLGVPKNYVLCSCFTHTRRSPTGSCFPWHMIPGHRARRGNL